MVTTLSVARADCTPAASNNVTATCSGTTINQGAGAPGTSAGIYGYGSGTETGVTVNVATGASISAASHGINVDGGLVINSGSITGTGGNGIFVSHGVTVINNAGASITGFAGSANGILVDFGVGNITNSGSITGQVGIGANANATVTNNAGGSIAGGDSGITVDANSTVTNNAGGSITGGSGYGIYLFGGGSSVFNAGTISGGTAAIGFAAGAGNTLTLAAGSAITGNVLGTGSDTLQLGGTGSATFDVSKLGSAAQYRGFGTFNKIGSSAWTLTGSSTFAGAVNVNAGTLSVNGTVASASLVTVNSGATLNGTGTVGNTLVSGGTFAPGSGAAGSSITVAGSLVMQAAATYLVQLNPATASFTTVTGAATLNGAAVSANFAAGSYVAKRYTILTAAGGVSGRFSGMTVTGQPASLISALSYDTNNAYLNLVLSYALLGGLNGNQQNVANALSGFFDRTGGIPTAFAALTPGQLAQSAGEGGTGSQQTTFNAMNQFMGVMTAPFLAGRGDAVSGAGGVSGYAHEATMAYATKRNPNDAMAAIYAKTPVAQAFAQRWSVWAAGYGGSQTTSGNAVVGGNNTTSSIYGTAVGADYRISPNTMAGFALAGGGTNFSVANVVGSGRSDLFQAGAFVRHNMGAAYLSGALAYGWQDITTNRTLTIAGIDQLRAQFNANAWSSRVEGGYRLVSQGIGWTPYAAGQFTTFDLPSYAEQAIVGANTFALAYGARSVTATRSELGVRTDRSFAAANGIFTLRGRLAWAHDYDPNRAIGATFQTLPGASFVVNGARQASDSALVTASAENKWLNGWSAAATFEGEFSNVSTSYGGKGVVRYSW